MTNSRGGYTEDTLSGMTIAQIKEAAKEQGYVITATKKADIIAEFLEQQNGSGV